MVIYYTEKGEAPSQEPQEESHQMFHSHLRLANFFVSLVLAHAKSLLVF